MAFLHTTSVIRWYVNVYIDIDIWTKLQLILNFILDNY